MNVKNLILNSLKYAALDWYNLLILGLILFLGENLYTLPGNPPGIDLYDITVIAFIGILWIMESGYIFRILEETVTGSTRSPKFNKIKELIAHGLNENIVLFIYLSIPLIIIAISIYNVKIFLKILELNPNTILYYLNSSKVLYFTIAGISSAIIYLWYLGVLLNMAHFKGTIYSGFNITNIRLRLKNAGFKNILLVYFLIIFVATILVLTFSTEDIIPIYIYKWNILDIITQFFIAPFLIIFSFRMLGLLDQKYRHK
jgi:hypothetical protein